MLAALTALRALLSVFHDRWQQFLLRFWRGHVIICGLSRKGWLLAQGFAARGNRVVVIEADEAHDLIGPCRERGIVVLVGDATDPDLLRGAGILAAGQLVAVTDDDGVNAEIAVRGQGLLRQAALTGHVRSRPLTCTVHLVDPQLYELARTREMALEAGMPLRLELFNVFERGARLLWSEYGPVPAMPAAAEPAAPDQDGQEPLRGPRAGDRPRAAGRKPDRDRGPRLAHAAARVARAWRAFGMQRGQPAAHHGGGSGGGLEMPGAEPALSRTGQRLRPDPAANGCPLARILRRGLPERPRHHLCGSRATRAAGQRGLRLLRRRFAGAAHRPGGPTARAACVCQPATGRGAHGRDRRAGASGRTRWRRNDRVFANLHAFGLLDRTCTPEAILGGTHEVLARGLHEVYVQQQEALGGTSVTNPALVEWDKLPEALRESNRAQADGIVDHLAAVGCILIPLADWDAADFKFQKPEVERLAQMEHERWLDFMSSCGFRPNADRKDLTAKRNPALRPWAELPEGERKKNRDTIRDLPATLARAGFEIVRLAPAGAPV